MKKLILSFLFLFCIISSAFSQWFTQTSSNPNTYPNLHGAKIQYMDLNTVYICGTNCMVMKSTNDGNTWFYVSPQTSSNVLLWGMHFLNANTGYVVGNFGFVAKTTNGGTNWNISSTPTPDTLWSVDFIDDNTGFISGSTGHIFKTTNGGNNWTSQNSGVIDHLRSVKFTNSAGFIGTHQSSVVLKTTNNGNNWISTSTLPTRAFIEIDYSEFATNFIVGAGGSGEVSKSINAGINWVSVPLPTSRKPFCVEVLYENTFFIGGELGMIYKTTNGGLNYTLCNSNTSAGINSIFFQNFNIGFAVGGGSNNWLGTTGCILKTTDGGLNWNVVAENTSTPQNIIYNKIDYIDPWNGWVSTNDKKILKTVNEGFAWATEYTSSQNINDLQVYGNDLGFAACNSGRVLKKTGASSWTELNLGITNHLNSIYLSGPSTLITCGTNGIILKSTNLGDTWQIISSPTTNKLNKVNGNFIVGTGVILKTTNLGDSWNIVYSNPGQEILSIVGATVENNWFAVGSNGFMLKSSNNGVNWTQLNLGLTNTLYDITTVYPQVLMACGTNGLIIKSLNLGASWVIENSSTNNTIRSIQIITPARATAAGDYSTVIRNNNLITSIETVSSTIPNEYKLNQNYPNPFNPETKIKFSLKDKSYVLLEVYSTAGELISTLVKSNLNAGEYEYTWNAANFSSGIYFYRLKTEGFTDTKKMILLK